MENNKNRCPECNSKRLKKLTLNNEYYCPKCSKKFSITVKEIEINSCFKCGKPVLDLCKGITMGNGKVKHKKCRLSEKHMLLFDETHLYIEEGSKNLEGMKNA